MKNMLSTYANDIRNAVGKSRRGEVFNFSGSEQMSLQKGASIGSLAAEKNLLTLDGMISPYSAETAQLGIHRDFAYLRGTDQTEYHYIVNVFMDMKGSTQLNDVYDPETLLYITNTVQRAAIHVCLWSGGHIQRLMGDAVFVYFGGRNVSKVDAIRQALTATSMFTYFIKNDIAAIFEEDGVENISTRTGIDFGDDRETLWGSFGTGNIVELTTQSKHTSIASPMPLKMELLSAIMLLNMLGSSKIYSLYCDNRTDDWTMYTKGDGKLFITNSTCSTG